LKGRRGLERKNFRKKEKPNFGRKEGKKGRGEEDCKKKG